MEGNQAVNENAALRIVEQEQIIAADSDARIWVNAGPGTGKTYTVIQRLKKLLQEEYEGTILVLCFSKNAVQVIRNRLHDTLGYQADQFLDEKRLEIRTFDSFATYMLADELNSKWNYDTRIEEFIRMIQRNPGVLDEILHYVIVDEVQSKFTGWTLRTLLHLFIIPLFRPFGCSFFVRDCPYKPDINRLDMLMLKKRLDQWKKEVRLQGYTPIIYVNYRTN